MSEREDILDALMQVIGEEGCGIACEEATVFKDEEGWKAYEVKSSTSVSDTYIYDAAITPPTVILNISAPVV